MDVTGTGSIGWQLCSKRRALQVHRLEGGILSRAHTWENKTSPPGGTQQDGGSVGRQLGKRLGFKGEEPLRKDVMRAVLQAADKGGTGAQSAPWGLAIRWSLLIWDRITSSGNWDVVLVPSIRLQIRSGVLNSHSWF